MAKRTWNFFDKFSYENDLQWYLAQKNVSVKRTEETAAEKKITYRCSKYRKYPACDFQIKIISNSDAEIMVVTSNAHDHDHEHRATTATTTRAPSRVRNIVIKTAAAGLSLGQTRRAVQNQYKSIVSSLFNNRRSLIIPDVYSLHDFRSWYQQHSALLSRATSNHEHFVAPSV